MKNLIIKFNYTELRNEAHVEYHETADKLVIKYNPESLGIKTLYDIYKPLLDAEVAVLDIIRKSEYTGEIAAQDHLRDKLFRGFADAVKSYLNHFNADKQHAAKKIETVLEHYGNIAAKAFDQETAAIDDLLRELNDSCNTEVNLLNLSDWLTQLDTENVKFKTLMAQRYTETAQRPSTKMKIARTEVDKIFRSMLNMIDALATVNGTGNYEAFIKELNAVSERYKNLLAQSAGRRKEKNTTAEQPQEIAE
jgi:murein L,D-transpeptidase YcbB/YkuD